ncbi:hypothetical protein [Postechiella marina]|uniref:hypothetical protein n=1 Tax=Postechiella marina TaxID=943941 RepID=UPI0031D77CA9
MSFGLNAQIDSKNKSFAIPAVKAPKDSLDSKPLLPAKPDLKDKLSSLDFPKPLPELNLPKKEFSMFPSEEFANPGELYTKKLEKIEKALLPEGHGENSGLKEDAYWGDYRTTSKYINIQYRDHGMIDGDLLRVIVNGDVIRSREYLSRGFNGFKLNLEEGFNKIEFYAINEGSALPNTAQYRIVDDKSSVITGKVWALAAGVKVTIIIIKE